MIFARRGGGRLVFGPDTLRVIDAHRQHDPRSAEAGGVLLGRVILERPDVLVDRASAPSAEDRRSRFRFFRARRPTQALIDAAHAASGGEHIYLGEWHTHPEDVPRPSRLDLDNWGRLARQARFEQDALFFLIAGWTATRVWEVPRRGGRCDALAPVRGTPSETGQPPRETAGEALANPPENTPAGGAARGADATA